MADQTTNSASSSSANSAATAATANANATALLNQYAKPILQPMSAPVTLDPTGLASGVPVYARMQPRMVGLLRRITLRAEVVFTVPTGTTITRGPFGPAQIISNFQFTDLNNNKRIDTSGLHLAALASVRMRQPAGSAFMTDSPLGFGNVVQGAISYPVPTGAGQYKATMTYDVPIAYMDGDYRGAIYLGTTQASATLQATINPLFFAPSSNNDNVDAVYIYDGVKPTINSITLFPYQDYLDQLPTVKNQLVLPQQSMGLIYQLIQATQTGITAGSDFRLDFGNLRTYMSLMTVFNNGGTLYPSTDLDSIKIEAANMYQFLNTDPIMLSYRNRCAIGEDMPAGMQYFPFRQQPVNTQMYGNLGVTFNANTVNAGAKIVTLAEFFSDTLTAGASQIGS